MSPHFSHETPHGHSGSGIGTGRNDKGGPPGYHVGSTEGFPFRHSGCGHFGL